MVNYSYYYYSPEDLHVVMICRDNGDGTVALRPERAYYTEKSAKAYIESTNQRIADRNRSYRRTNPPIRYFQVPDWWTAKFPNWNRMKKVG